MGIDVAVLMCLRDIRHNKFEDSLIGIVTPSIPRPAPTIEQIKQDNFGKVEITFNRRNSFSSRIEASRSEYESSRRSFSETLRKDFYSSEIEPQRRWFFQHFKGPNRKQIQDKFYEFFERVKINVLFFDWFQAYTIKEDIDYTWKQDIIGDPTTNAIWQIKDEERGENNFKSFSANNIYEWNIDAQTEYNIMNTLQHMTMRNSQQPFWKEKFLAGLPRSLGDKVRDKIHSQPANGDIPFESLSYGQLISYVQKVALKICQDDKIQRQLAKEKAQTKRDLGSFYEQFGLPTCPKQKKQQSSTKETQENKISHNKRFPRRRYSHKPSTSKEIENPKQKLK
ncbi:hypothetical protein JHK82_048223 [Glycine max]|uniref:Uncharacterized protein n=1 Tax=Glycine max TaxID=3847 RepID=A0A0R0FFQ9_SOYBN|nr:hypothetical protein JHK86_048102 [Glycine max]KAG4944078.1 hypothetical protein JHK85_048724 [Glycine max]KAG5098369.1 hypothetical protein JHK82_048223 [Glycine max]KAG5103165.1 hypothetical protein JHK84_048134 [Glycine max]